VTAVALRRAEAQALEFEVATVKRITGEVRPHPVALLINHGRLDIEAATLRQVVGLAYGIQRVRVLGGPGWIDSDFYDFVGKAENPDTGRDQIRQMLQTLLTDRFKLAVHYESKELPVYTLIPLKNGPRLDEAKADDKLEVTPRNGPAGFEMAFQKMSISGLVNTLANVLGSPVLDGTGLKGLYNFKLHWDRRPPQAPTNDGTPSSESGPDLFTALQEQLGLKLEPKKAPEKVLVIDRVEPASEN